MATAATLRSLVASLALATALAAQARAPFSGTVRDLAGAPIRNAAVTCAWNPDFSALGAPDRVTATTDAAGS